jgi:chemotaxis family two-component system response regulator Rcp1
MKVNPFRPLQIFLAEDNRADVLLVEMALREHGVRFALHWLADGEKAMQAAEAFGQGEPVPDIALLDLNLPREEGDRVLEKLRGNPYCKDIPIIVMTSSESPRDRQTAEQFGATFFSKPSNLTQFLQLGKLVKRLCEARARAAQA